MNTQSHSNKADVLFSLLLFCTFAVSVLTTLMLGASFYKNMTDTSRSGYDERTAVSYVWTKVKNSDHIGMISVSDFYGIPALLLHEVYGETTYVTRIYPFDGWVYELFCELGLDMLPEDGTPIIKTGSLYFEQTADGMIKISADKNHVYVYPRGAEGIARRSLN